MIFTFSAYVKNKDFIMILSERSNTESRATLGYGREFQLLPQTRYQLLPDNRVDDM